MNKTPAIDVERMQDLLRYCRGQLHTDGLITNEEYVSLLAVEGAVARLCSYDEARAQATRLLNVARGCHEGGVR